MSCRIVTQPERAALEPQLRRSRPQHHLLIIETGAGHGRYQQRRDLWTPIHGAASRVSYRSPYADRCGARATRHDDRVRLRLRRDQIADLADDTCQRFDPPDVSLDEGRGPIVTGAAKQACDCLCSRVREFRGAKDADHVQYESHARGIGSRLCDVRLKSDTR